jgi:hypothetical protein
MSTPVAVYDACVLYSAPVRDLLVRVALADMVRAHWTNQIHDEWTHNLLVNRPNLSPASIARTRQLLDVHVPNALVTGYEDRIPSLTLPDPEDRHVVAAAIQCKANTAASERWRYYGLLIPTKLPPFSRESAHKNAPTSGDS